MSSNKKRAILFFGAAGLSIAAVGGAITYYYINRRLKPNRVLDSVKNQLADQTGLVGSWISHIPAHLTKDRDSRYVYHGALQVVKNGELLNYHFTADTHSGELLSFELRATPKH